MRLARLLAVLVALTCVGAQPAGAALPTTLSTKPVYRLVQSTGNLYWTSGGADAGIPYAAIYRASKSNAPGQERRIWTEYLIDEEDIYFGDVLWSLQGTYYAYFVANYYPANNGQPFSLIKRVPLDGSTAAVTLAQSPRFVGLNDLVTDDHFLYWADLGGLRRLPIGGGAVETLAAGGSTSSSVGIDLSRVFWTVGTGIYSVPKTGGAVTKRVTAGSNVTTMFVKRYPSTVYWGERNGAVNSLDTDGGTITHHQASSPQGSVNSVFFDGWRLLWTDCKHLGDCYVRYRYQSSYVTTVATTTKLPSNVAGDNPSLFWSEEGVGLRKLNYQ